MSAHVSAPELLAFHGVRVLGSPSADRVARRFRLDPAQVRETLLDAQASGWVSRYEFFGDVTWAMTEAGRVEDERLLAAELAATGTRPVVATAHRGFLELNAAHGEACTNWQLRPTRWEPAAANDHSDLRWDLAVLEELTRLDAALARVCEPLSDALARFDGHAGAHSEALRRVSGGDGAWLDAPDRASAQLVWIQLHEDLLATLGIPRGSDS